MIGNSINVYFILVVRLFGGEKVQYMHVYAQDPGHAVCYAKVKCNFNLISYTVAACMIINFFFRKHPAISIDGIVEMGFLLCCKTKSLTE